MLKLAVKVCQSKISDIRSQISEVRGQKSEGRSQRAEGRGQRTEIRGKNVCRPFGAGETEHIANPGLKAAGLYSLTPSGLFIPIRPVLQNLKIHSFHFFEIRPATRYLKQWQ
jgi:hypothetical protein